MAYNAKRRQDKYGRLYDPDTGEYDLDGSVLVVAKKSPGLPYERSLVMNQDMMLSALARSDLGQEAFRVFFAVCSKLDFENLIAIHQSSLATQIGMAKPNFSRGLKRLIETGVIEAGPIVQGKRTFRLNPMFGWKGQTRNHRKLMKDRAEVARRAKAAGLSVVKGANDQSTRETLEKRGQQRLV